MTAAKPDDEVATDASEIGHSTEHALGDPNIVRDAVAAAVRYARMLVVYLASLTAFVWGLTKLDKPLQQIYGGNPWLLMCVAVLPLVGALAFEAIPAWLRRRRKKRLVEQGVHGKLSHPGYFRIT